MFLVSCAASLGSLFCFCMPLQAVCGFSLFLVSCAATLAAVLYASSGSVFLSVLDVLFGSCTEFGYVCGRTYGLEDGLDRSWLRVWTHVTWLAGCSMKVWIEA